MPRGAGHDRALFDRLRPDDAATSTIRQAFTWKDAAADSALLTMDQESPELEILLLTN